MHKKFYSGKVKRGDRFGGLCVSGKGNIYLFIYFYIYVFMYVLCIYLFRAIYSLFTTSVARIG